MENSNFTYVGKGIYGVPEASRLTQVAPARIRRWLLGYSYKYAGELHTSPRLLASDFPVIDNTTSLSFLQLIEIRFVDAFRSHGVSWKTIRLAAECAHNLYSQAHPFATKSFRTDGRTIFAEIIEKTGEKSLLDIVRNQYAFQKIIDKSLYKGIEFSDDGVTQRWWPLGKRKSVVIDPARSFGQPITDREGVPTAILAKAFLIEESIKRVSGLYEVSEKSVRDSIEFEKCLAA